MQPRTDFADRSIIVTGGASGMGAACAREFSARGGHVLIVDVNADLAHEVATEIDADVLTGDISDSSFCSAAVGRAVERRGKVDCLVNAAGIIVRSTGERTTDEEWQRVMRVNVDGTFFMCRSTIRSMLGTGGGSIVNFGSVWGDLGAAGVAAYCASKGAVHNLTRSLALEHAQQGIRVNAVCPGEIDTPMLSSARSEPPTSDMLAALAATVPMGRLGQPGEVARVVAFLASDEASYMTGSMVRVDAGYGAQ